MRRHFVPLAVAVSSFGLVQIASAADMPVKAPVKAVAPSSWTGFYVGGNVGGGWSRDNNINYVPDPTGAAVFFLIGGTPNLTSIKNSGVLGGGQLGYNWQFAPAWVAGLETDFDWSGIKGNGTSNLLVGVGGPTFPFAATAAEQVTSFGTARARLGFLPVNNLLAFVTGGFAYGRVYHSAAYLNNSGGSVTGGTLNCPANSTCLAGSSSTMAGGWTAGGGFEYAVAPKWTVKAEYLYVSLAGSSSVIETPAAATGTGSINAAFGRTIFNVARVGANYRF